MTLTFKEVSEIMKIIDASECEEVILELEGIRLVVRRGGAATANQAGAPSQPSPVAQAASQTAPVAPPAASGSQPEPKAASPVSSGGTEIRAPMVGSFYRCPSPDQPPFVEVGTRVAPGDPLCLIEVMKLYTTIEATIAGTIKQIAVEDAQLVEFDQLLFVVEPD